MQADAFTLSGIAKFNSLRINEMLYLVKKSLLWAWTSENPSHKKIKIVKNSIARRFTFKGKQYDHSYDK
ncbi:MAG: hypothetical protein V7K77_31455 [Nostoc sp.]|uniref:hypothetical protein n=1 Tax=Nostoc sp. TaxID=1180 RepID=UPI002FF833F2